MTNMNKLWWNRIPSYFPANFDKLWWETIRVDMNSSTFCNISIMFNTFRLIAEYKIKTTYTWQALTYNGASNLPHHGLELHLNVDINWMHRYMQSQLSYKISPFFCRAHVPLLKTIETEKCRRDMCEWFVCVFVLCNQNATMPFRITCVHTQLKWSSCCLIFSLVHSVFSSFTTYHRIYN